MRDRPPVSRARLRAALEAGGAAPRKRHGQHFLLDDNLLAAIVRDAGVGPGDPVLEVGPGPGLLTRHLLGAGCRVTAVEIDVAMETVATALLGPPPGDDPWPLRWIRADALPGARRLGPELEAVLPEVGACVSNLPYGIAGPLLGAFAVHPSGPARSVVMVQRELALRLAAPVGGRDYGPLAVLLALTSRVKVLRKVPPGAFWPPPRVDSAVVAIDRKADAPPPEALAAVERFLALAFHSRRKTLPNSLSEATGEPAAACSAALGLTENQQKQRPEAFEALQLCDLAQVWADHALGERYRP